MNLLTKFKLIRGLNKLDVCDTCNSWVKSRKKIEIKYSVIQFVKYLILV